MAPCWYDRAICTVLLRAKMQALDRGVDFPVQDDLVCERCRQVFASLDVGADACRSLRGRTMPAALRKSIEKAMRASTEAAFPPARLRGSRKRRGSSLCGVWQSLVPAIF